MLIAIIYFSVSLSVLYSVPHCALQETVARRLRLPEKVIGEFESIRNDGIAVHETLVQTNEDDEWWKRLLQDSDSSLVPVPTVVPPPLPTPTESPISAPIPPPVESPVAAVPISPPTESPVATAPITPPIKSPVATAPILPPFESPATAPIETPVLPPVESPTGITQTILDIIVDNEDLSILENAVFTADLQAALNGSDFLTLLAPLNEAFVAIDQAYFDQLLSPPWILHLQDLLKFHVTDAGTIISTDLVDRQVIEMLNGELVNVKIEDNVISFTSRFTVEATVVGADFFATNGVVHEINSVLSPNFIGLNIVDLASEIETLSTFSSLIALAGLTEQLNSGLFTVFAPTDQAFSRLSQETLDLLTSPENQKELRDLLLYHIVEGVLPSVLLENGLVRTLQGSDLLISDVSEDSFRVNTFPVPQPDNLANNGIIHGVGRVLFPSVTAFPTLAPAQAPVITPVSTPIELPISEPISSPVMVPVEAPAALPILVPVAAPVAAPVAIPVAAPVAFPVAAPVAIPVAAPVAFPVAAPVIAPVPAPIRTPTTGDTILDVIERENDLSILEQSVSTANLGNILANQGPLTLFGPVDSAFRELNQAYFEKLLTPDWILHLQNLLLYQLTLAGELTSSSFFNREIITMVNFENVTINVVNSVVSVTSPQNTEASTLVEFDIDASNGIVHKTDAVLLPKFIATNLVDLLSQTEGFSTLVSLIELVPDLAEFLNQGDYTFLAPINSAFASLDQTTLDFLTNPANVNELRNLLLYHVVPRVIPSLELRNGPIATEQGASVQVQIVNANLVRFNDVDAVQLNGLASNGIVHALGGVLTPPSGGTDAPISPPVSPLPPVAAPVTAPSSGNNLFDIISGESDLSSLVDAVTAAGLIDSLSTGIDLALMAPVNSAFESFDQQLLQRLLQPEWIAHLRNVLLFHITGGELPSSALVSGLTLFMINGEQVTVTGSTSEPELSGDLFANIGFVEFDLVASNGVVHKIEDVMIPSFADTTIVDALAGIDSYSIISGLLETTDLSLPAAYTILAPTNAAFQDLPTGTLDTLRDPANVEQRRNFLLEHIIEGVLPSPNLVSRTITSLGGSTIQVVVDIVDSSQLIIEFNGARASQLDILGNNGLAYGIDSALL